MKRLFVSVTAIMFIAMMAYGLDETDPEKREIIKKDPRQGRMESQGGRSRARLKPGETGIGGIAFVNIPAGEFMMGSPNSDPESNFAEKPQHTVHVDSFHMSVYEITQAVYEEVMGKNPSRQRGGNFPVENVTWNDAVAFCAAFSKKYDVAMRLPTEAEWEYACRAGTVTRYYWGDQFDKTKVISRDSAARPFPVGSRQPNPWGLHDMLGNMQEWCLDVYDVGYYAKSPAKNPAGLVNSASPWRSIRGGGFTSSPRRCRCAYRLGDYTHYAGAF